MGTPFQLLQQSDDRHLLEYLEFQSIHLQFVVIVLQTIPAHIAMSMDAHIVLVIVMMNVAIIFL